MRRTLFIAAAIAVAMSGPVRAADQPNIAALKGFAGIEFGESLASAKEKQPAMRVIRPSDHRLSAAAFTSPFLVRYTLTDQKLEGVPTPTQVELRFWRDQLWAFIVYHESGENQQVRDYLVSRYGSHTTGSNERPIWKGDRVTLQVMPQSSWFGATSNSISDDARAWFFKALTGHSEGNAGKDEKEVEKSDAAPAADPQKPAAEKAQ